jgi:hypothetical protein
MGGSRLLNKCASKVQIEDIKQNSDYTAHMGTLRGALADLYRLIKPVSKSKAGEAPKPQLPPETPFPEFGFLMQRNYDNLAVFEAAPVPDPSSEDKEFNPNSLMQLTASHLSTRALWALFAGGQARYQARGETAYSPAKYAEHKVVFQQLVKEVVALGQRGTVDVVLDAQDKHLMRFLYTQVSSIQQRVNRVLEHVNDSQSKANNATLLESYIAKVKGRDRKSKLALRLQEVIRERLKAMMTDLKQELVNTYGAEGVTAAHLQGQEDKLRPLHVKLSEIMASQLLDAYRQGKRGAELAFAKVRGEYQIDGDNNAINSILTKFWPAITAGFSLNLQNGTKVKLDAPNLAADHPQLVDAINKVNSKKGEFLNWLQGSNELSFGTDLNRRLYVKSVNAIRKTEPSLQKVQIFTPEEDVCSTPRGSVPKLGAALTDMQYLNLTHLQAFNNRLQTLLLGWKNKAEEALLHKQIAESTEKLNEMKTRLKCLPAHAITTESIALAEQTLQQTDDLRDTLDARPVLPRQDGLDLLAESEALLKTAREQAEKLEADQRSFKGLLVDTLSALGTKLFTAAKGNDDVSRVGALTHANSVLRTQITAVAKAETFAGPMTAVKVAQPAAQPADWKAKLQQAQTAVENLYISYTQVGFFGRKHAPARLKLSDVALTSVESTLAKAAEMPNDNQALLKYFGQEGGFMQELRKAYAANAQRSGLARLFVPQIRTVKFLHKLADQIGSEQFGLTAEQRANTVFNEATRKALQDEVVQAVKLPGFRAAAAA